jgi:hypothetical protein
MNSILLTEEAAQWIDGLDDRENQKAGIKRARKIAKEL